MGAKIGVATANLLLNRDISLPEIQYNQES